MLVKIYPKKNLIISATQLATFFTLFSLSETTSNFVILQIIEWWRILSKTAALQLAIFFKSTFTTILLTLTKIVKYKTKQN